MRLRTRDRRPGAAAAELACLLPVLAFIAVVTADWARIMRYTITLENATRAGALYACDSIAQKRSPSDPAVLSSGKPITSSGTNADLVTGTQYAARAEAPNLGSNITVTSVDTSQKDAAGNSVVIVTATLPFQTFSGFSYGKLFGVENNVTLSRTVQMRTLPVTPK